MTEREILAELARAIARNRDEKWHGNTVEDPRDARLYEALVWAQGYEFDFQPPLDVAA